MLLTLCYVTDCSGFPLYDVPCHYISKSIRHWAGDLLSWQGAHLTCIRLWLRASESCDLNVVVHTCDPSIWDAGRWK